MLDRAMKAGAVSAVISKVWAEGGKGGIDLAKAVIEACEMPSTFKHLYELDRPIKEKIETIATKIYGADGVDYSPVADRQIRRYTKLGFDHLPICMPRPISRSRQILTSRAVRATSGSASARSVRPWARASCTRC